MRECERFAEQVSALLDGELSAEAEAEVRAHMALCPDCRAMYEAFSSVGDAIGGLDVPDTLHAGIMEKVHAAEKAGRTQHTIVRLRPILAAAACLVVLVGTIFALNNTLGHGPRADKSAADAPMAPNMSIATAGGSAPAEAEAATQAMEEDRIFESKAETGGASNGWAERFDAAVPEEPREAPKAAAASNAEMMESDGTDREAAAEARFTDTADEAKLVSYENADAVIAASALVVRAEKLGEEATDFGTDRCTVSSVRVLEVFQDARAAVTAGDTVNVREPQWTDAESGTVYHPAGYCKMETGEEYLLLLHYDEAQDSYSPTGLLYGKIPLDEGEAPSLGGHEDIRNIQTELRERFCA